MCLIVSARLSTRRRLLSSVVVFIGGVLAVSSLLTSLVDSDMYGGSVGTGEDYYYSWGGWGVNQSAASPASVATSAEPLAINIGLIMVNSTNSSKLLNNFKVT